MPSFDLPDDLVAFLRAGRLLEGVDALFGHDITLLPLDQLDITVFQVEDLTRLALEHQGAAGGVADDDRVIAIQVGGQVTGQPQDDLAGVIEQPAGLQRQPDRTPC